MLQKFRFKLGNSGPLDVKIIMEMIENSISIQETIKSSLIFTTGQYSESFLLNRNIIQILQLNFAPINSVVIKSRLIFNNNFENSKSIDETGIISDNISLSVDSLRMQSLEIHEKIEELRLDHEMTLGFPILYRFDSKEGMCIDIDKKHLISTAIELRLELQLSKKQPSTKFSRYKCLVSYFFIRKLISKRYEVLDAALSSNNAQSLKAEKEAFFQYAGEVTSVQ